MCLRQRAAVVTGSLAGISIGAPADVAAPLQGRSEACGTRAVAGDMVACPRGVCCKNGTHCADPANDGAAGLVVGLAPQARGVSAGCPPGCKRLLGVKGMRWTLPAGALPQRPGRDRLLAALTARNSPPIVVGALRCTASAGPGTQPCRGLAVAIGRVRLLLPVLLLRLADTMVLLLVLPWLC